MDGDAALRRVLEEGKISQEEANYQSDGGKGSTECATCKFYIQRGACYIVDGEIGPEGVSNYYMPHGEGEPIETILRGERYEGSVERAVED